MGDEKTAGPAEQFSFDENLDEHRHCMQIVSDVESCLDRPPDREGAWIGCLLEKLPVLTDTLRDHFKGEMKGDLYRELPKRFPRFADRLKRLAAEHGEILQMARAAHESGKALQGASEIHELRQFNARVQLLIASIRRHEAEENEIMMRAYWNELGEGD